VPVSDASARRAAAWLAAWARAGLLGSDPEVVGYVCDLLNFVGERTMKKTDDELVQSWQRSVDDVAKRLRANLGVTRCEADLADGFVHLLTHVRELEAEVARLREGLRPFADQLPACEGHDDECFLVNAIEYADWRRPSPHEDLRCKHIRRAAELLGDSQ